MLTIVWGHTAMLFGFHEVLYVAELDEVNSYRRLCEKVNIMISCRYSLSNQSIDVDDEFM